MKKVQRRLAVTMASLLIIECLLTPLSLWADSLSGQVESFVSPDYATIGSIDEDSVINDEEQNGRDDRSIASDVDSPSSVSNESGSAATDSTNSEKGSPVEFGSIAYQAHVQDIGWQDTVSDGITAGTTGRAKRVEALKINLLARDGSPFENDSISVQAHVSGIGWDAQPVGNGQVSGTVGQSRAIEAIKLTLSSNLSDTYDIWYRVHSANVGWLGWTSNGEPAGTQGYAYPIEAIQIKVILKNAQDAPVHGDAFKDHAQEPPTVSYRSHVSNVGWTSVVTNGNTSVLLTQGMQSRRCLLVLLGMDTEALSLLGHMCLASVGRTGLQVPLERRVSLGPLRLSSLG